MDEKQDEKGLRFKKSENFSDWYVDVIIKSGFVDYSPVSGMMVLRPDAYFAWEQIMGYVDKELKGMGVQNTYFPILIPEHLLKKEENHIEHFKAEVAWVTQGGDSTLDERLAIRPTSETIIYDIVSKWIRSWRELPMKLNMWNNVVRWEFKHPTPFLRTREFLWNEGHSIYATEQDAQSERDGVIRTFKGALAGLLCLPCIVGKKTEQEKFAGGVASYSLEMLMPDGKMIQGPDWHFDGQNFSRAFEISFLNKDGKKEYAWQSTYAISTRVLGVMIATHGDDKGLILPPKMARIQIVIVPIYKNENKTIVMEKANNIREILAKNFRVYLDERDDASPGWKFNEWELKGVPLRIEIGERDINAGKFVLFRRDTLEKIDVPLELAAKTIKAEISAFEKRLYKKAEAFIKSMSSYASEYEEMKKTLLERRGIVSAPWCGLDDCENKIKDETGAKITNMPFDAKLKPKSKCIYCKKDAKYIANFAKSY